MEFLRFKGVLQRRRSFYGVEPQFGRSVTTGTRFRNVRSAPRRKWLSRVDRRLHDGVEEIDMAKQGKRKQKQSSGRKKNSSKSGMQKPDDGASSAIRPPEEQ